MSDFAPKLRAVLAEDEPLTRASLADLLAKCPGVEIVAQCRNGLEAVRAICEHRPDVVFLDIEMPKLDGFEVLELIEEPVAVVFVTAFDHYAVRAFEAAAVDYVLKPISPERLAAAVARIPGRPLSQGRVDHGALRRQALPERPYLERLAIKDGVEVLIFDVDDVDYVSSEDDYVAIHVSGRTHLKHQTMASLERALDPRRFARIHRTCLVAVDRVARVEQETKDRFTVTLTDRTELPASPSGMRRLREALGL